MRKSINQSILSSLFITPIPSRLQHPQACKLATNKRSLLQKSSSKTSSTKISLKTSCQKLYSVQLTSFKQKPQISTQRIQFPRKDWLTDWLPFFLRLQEHKHLGFEQELPRTHTAFLVRARTGFIRIEHYLPVTEALAWYSVFRISVSSCAL